MRSLGNDPLDLIGPEGTFRRNPVLLNYLVEDVIPLRRWGLLPERELDFGDHILSASRASLEPENGREPVHILVVEDEVITRSVAAEFLRESGLIVIEAASGDEAWHYLACGGKAELVFTDLKMPGAIQGEQLVDRIQANFPAIKIIVTSGNGGPLAAVTYSDFMQKPYDLDEVLDRIVKSLGIDKP